MTGGCIRGEYGPVALETKLGWVLSGSVPGTSATSSTQTNLTQTHVVFVQAENDSKKDPLKTELSKFWELESLGIVQAEEEMVYEKFEENIRFLDGRYEVKLPWKKEHPELPDNYKLSLGRLNSLKKKLNSKPEILQKYDEVIKDQEKMGIIERVKNSERTPVGKTHYIPHQPVVKQDRDTTKLRIVYDASAKVEGGTSLNNCLYPGPCLLHNIAEILTRFRFYKTALFCDIEKAFLMIAVHPDDCDALRFLWFENINDENSDVIPMRFRRVSFGVSSSPFLLNATLNHHIRKYKEIYPEVVDKLLLSMYVDDASLGSHSEDECMQIYVASKKIMNDAGFNLRKWRTNSANLQQKIEIEEEKLNNIATSTSAYNEESYSEANINPTPKGLNSSEQGVLGLTWDYERDTLKFKLSRLLDSIGGKPITKRILLGSIAKIYDPLGLITPMTTPMKVLFQEICLSKSDWDDPIPENLRVKWSNFVDSCKKAIELEVPRYYFNENSEKSYYCRVTWIL